MKLGAAFLEDRDGAAAIVIAFMTPILIGGLAFGAEVGGWEMTKRRIQNAADTAAYAAGTPDERALAGWMTELGLTGRAQAQEI